MGAETKAQAAAGSKEPATHIGNVAFAHGPHIVARAAPRLNPAQSTLHSCCSIKAAEPLPAETLAGRHATCMHRCIRKKWPQMAH